MDEHPEWKGIDFAILEALLKASPEGVDNDKKVMTSENKIAKTIGTYTRKVARALPGLIQNGYVERLNERGKQNSKLHAITLKGLFYFLYYGNPNYSNISALFVSFYSKIDDRRLRAFIRYLTKEKKLLIPTITKAIEDTRYRISLEPFNSNYALSLLMSSIMRNVFEAFASRRAQAPMSSAHLKSLMRTPAGEVIMCALSQYIADLEKDYSQVKNQLDRAKSNYQKLQKVMSVEMELEGL